MKIKDIMTEDVEIVSPSDTLQAAAQKMLDCDCGILPVGDNDRLVGMISDRDIAMRAVASGMDPCACTVAEVMSRDVKYCYEDDTDAELAQIMKDLQVKRLPVLNRQKRLVGIVSLGDLALAGNAACASEALKGISQHTPS
jgi:CBS domain-containing protein